MSYYSCDALDKLNMCKRVVCWHGFEKEKLEKSFLTPNQMRQKVSGLLFSKHVNGERIKLSFENDYKIGSLLKKVTYSNKYVEEFEYEYMEGE